MLLANYLQKRVQKIQNILKPSCRLASFIGASFLLASISMGAASCSISNTIPRPINAPILTAIQAASGQGYTLSTTLHNVETGFIGYRMLQSNTSIPDPFQATSTCTSEANVCNSSCCDCINLNATPSTSGTYVMEIFNQQDLSNSASSRICAFATSLQSGNQLALFAIVRLTNSILTFSRRSNPLNVP